MAVHGGPRFVVCALGLLLLPIVPMAEALSQTASGPRAAAKSDPSAQNPFLADAMRGDASLADVMFVDPQRGWAVGALGTIWQTLDGGQQWQLQPSTVDCRLESVFFLDPENGWAVGGYSHPYRHTTTGVVLVTHDGGKTWNYDSRLFLPALKQVRFFDHKHGWAVGSSSALFPSALFGTDSGARGWNALPGGQSAGWQAADFVTEKMGTGSERSEVPVPVFSRMAGAVAGQDGLAAVVRRSEIQPARTSRFGLRRIGRIKLVPPAYGWLVGDGGLVAITRDLGATWEPTHAPLPDGASQFDFTALAVRGEKVWVAGSPGTRVFFTSDAGLSWTAFDTGQQTPINGLWFVDEQHGWAVGDLGTILATHDGGQTWQRQRAGGSRAALLGIFSEPEQTPLELLAALSGNEGYLAVVHLLGRHDLDGPAPHEMRCADRLDEAAVAVGASRATAAWRFPLPPRGLGLPDQRIVAAWDRVHEGRGLQELEAHLVRQIRLWRPEVIVTQDASPRGNDPLANLVNRAVVQAVRLAADPAGYPEQTALTGLAPWPVKKVCVSLEPGLKGTCDVNSAELAERLGRSLADITFLPRSLIADRFDPPPKTLGFRTIWGDLAGPGRADLFTGISLQPGGDARRPWSDAPQASLDLIRRTAAERRNVRAILDHIDSDPQAGLGVLAQIDQLTRGLDGDDSAQLLYDLAHRHLGLGQWVPAAEVLQKLVDQHPGHRLCRPALVWLVQQYASEEVALRVLGPAPMGTGSERSEAPVAALPAHQARLEYAAALGKRIGQIMPDLGSEPSIGFALAAANRRRGMAAEAARFYVGQRHGISRDAWQVSAQGELWLADPTPELPKPILGCASAPGKPRLDGRLDDAVWQQAKPAELKNAQADDADWPALVLAAHDDQFLYLAVHCRQAPGASYEPTGGARPRDPDLSTRDRVDIYLDIDRDYATWHHLAVDYRGWASDDCWGDRTWDPAWFIAAATDPGAWTVEAAIPLNQLTAAAPITRQVWALGIQRTVPRVGLQSWCTSGSARIRPEEFGYLAFE